MSISHLEYTCTACDYHSTSLSLHGRRYYAFNDRLLRASYKIGWCFGCHALAPIESLIETTKHEQKKERLAKMKIELEQKIANKPKVERTWFQKLVGVKEQISEGSVFESYEFKALSTEIEDEIILLKLFEARRAPTKCLECGGEKHMYLSKIEARDELYNQSSPVQIGFKHPFCGGQITARCSDVRFHIRPKQYVYDLEGNFVDKVISE